MWFRKSVATLTLFAASLVSWLFPSDASAAPCVAAPLSVYILLGSSGCTVTDKLFFDFAHTPREEDFEAGPIPATSILVTPIPTPGNPGLKFSSPLWIEPPFGIVHAFIEYTVQTQGALIKGSSLGMVAEASGEEAFAHVIEIKCLEGTIAGGEDCSSNNAFNLEVTASETSTDLSDSITFGPASLIDVFMIVEVRAQPPFPPPTFGDAELLEVTQQFSQVAVGAAEPATFLLMGMALVGLFAQRRRSLTKTASSDSADVK